MQKNLGNIYEPFLYVMVIRLIRVQFGLGLGYKGLKFESSNSLSFHSEPSLQTCFTGNSLFLKQAFSEWSKFSKGSPFVSNQLQYH